MTRCASLAIAVAVAGCYDELVPCGDLTCPPGMVCSPAETCVLPAQLTVCEGMGLPDGTTCGFGVPTVSGFCRAGACVVARCGDGFVDPNEVCDDGNNASFDGCRADCESRFQDMNVLPAAAYLAIWAADHHAYAVGPLGTAIEFDGTTWSDRSTASLAPIGQAMAVWSNGTDVWVGGQHGLFRRSGDAWIHETVGAAPITASIHAIWGIGGDVYAGGGDGVHATLLHWTQATGWTDAGMTLPATCVTQQTEISGLWADTQMSLLTANPLGVCTWSPATPAKATFTSFLVAGATGLALTGSERGVYAAFNTSDGAPMIQRVGDATAVEAPGPVSGIAVTGPEELLAVGANGKVFRLDLTATDPSHAWTNVPTLSPFQLRAVTGTNPSNVFVVGDAGTVLH